MEVTLFDFDFSQEEGSIEDKKEVFESLVDLMKEWGNPYSIDYDRLSVKIKSHMDDFIKEGWVINVRGTLQIAPEYIKYHTVEELTRDYESKMAEILQNPDVCWYNDVLSLRNFFGPIRFKNDDEDREKFYQEKKRITKNAAMKLGLDHFINVPTSRGSKMSAISSKWAKKNVLPLIAKHVIPITDIDEMEDFFKEHVFFFGRRDWDWGKQNIPIAPYPVFKGLTPTEFDLACLCEANDEKTVGLILDYVGSYSGGRIAEEKKVIYPEGWSFIKYEESLTEEDRKLIEEDKERLARLHGKA